MSIDVNIKMQLNVNSVPAACYKSHNLMIQNRRDGFAVGNEHSL